MWIYTPDQWTLFFFFYCFCGWIWESCYVSARQGRWVNRGFLHGPLLPIYGSGALIILLATIRVRQSYVLVFVFGMAAATILEYCTGALMERLFKVRYWDYTNQPFNLNGHICLFCSLGWGVFSLILVRFIHPNVAQLLVKVPQFAAEPLAFALVAGMTVDVVQSVHAALDLRAMLIKLTEENEDLRRLARRAEIISAFAEEDLQRFREKTALNRVLLSERMEQERRERRAHAAHRRAQQKTQMEQTLRVRATARLKALDGVAQALEECLARLKETKELSAEVLESQRKEIVEALEKVRAYQAHVRERTAATYRKSMRILRANPSASAERYSEAMEALRHLSGTKRDD